MATLARFSVTSSSALRRLLVNRNAGLAQQRLPSMTILSAIEQGTLTISPMGRDIDSAAKRSECVIETIQSGWEAGISLSLESATSGSHVSLWVRRRASFV